jgi:D-beta-D-heptose 7-phosphate kinase/D-beta-D-heptose 1-phosphate adenosyltransferase
MHEKSDSKWRPLATAPILGQAPKQPHIVVIGDLMLDHYLWGECKRISPEAPVQVVNITRESHSLGGAGNVINNLVSLGCRASVIGVTGDDPTAETLQQLMHEQKIDTSGIIRDASRQTTIKSRLIASHQQIVRYDQESSNPVSSATEELMLAALQMHLQACDIVLISDYAKGVLTPSFTRQTIELCSSRGIRVLVDPKGSDYAKYAGAWLVKPNRNETLDATGIDPDEEQAIKEAGELLRSRHRISNVLITLSDKGMSLISDAEFAQFPAHAIEVFDVTGAGDTVLGALGYSLASGSSLKQAVELANAAGAVVVGKLGSATVTIDEIQNYQSREQLTIDSQQSIVSLNSLQPILETEKRRGRRIVFTNGCFDIIHAGHIHYLCKARELGDILVLGLNSDASVQRLKGNNRPINNEQDRAFVVAALKAVDYVVIFDEETPYNLIRKISPHLLVKGGDYVVDEIVGREFADETVVLPFIDGKSTSSTIKAIRAL